MAEWLIDLHFRPPLGAAVTVLFMAAAVASAVWMYLVGSDQPDRPWRWVLLGLRLGALAVVAWLLAGPSVNVGQDGADRPIPIVFLADTSASMCQRDVWDPAAVVGPSKSVGDRMITRWRAMADGWFDPQHLQRLNDQGAHVQLYGFDSRVRAMSVDEARQLDRPSGASTDLFGAIASVTTGSIPTGLDGEPLVQGLVVVLSDGHDTSGRGPQRHVESLMRGRWPVLTVAVGAPRSRPDLAVAAWAGANFVFEGQTTRIDAVVSQRGFDHQRARVELFHEERLVAAQEIGFGDGSVARVSFRVTPPMRPGQNPSLQGYRVQARVIPSPGDQEKPAGTVAESFMDNNGRWVFVRVSRDRIRVVLFEASPYWDTRFLARALGSDPQVELTAVYGLGADRTLIQRSEADRLAEACHEVFGADGLLNQAQLNRFDVVILGKDVQRFFGGDRAMMLVDFVKQRGGALVLARGQAFDTATPSGQRAGQILSEIEPVQWGNGVVGQLKLQLAHAGRGSPLTRFEHLDATEAILTRLPDMIAATRIEREKAASVVLLDQVAFAPQHGESGWAQSAQNQMAAVAYQHVGYGRVFGVLGDGMWRWAFLPADQSRDDSVYGLFWTRVIHWLATGGQFLPGRSVTMDQSSLAAQPGQAVTVTVTTRFVKEQDFDPVLEVTAPDGRSQRIAMAPGIGQQTRYTAVVRPSQPGVHKLSVRVTTNDPTLAAQASGLNSRLAVYDSSIEQLDTSARPDLMAAISQATGGHCLEPDQPRQLLEHVRGLRHARKESVRDRYVFDQPAAMVLVTGLFGLEWFLRRRLGLI